MKALVEALSDLAYWMAKERSYDALSALKALEESLCEEAREEASEILDAMEMLLKEGQFDDAWQYFEVLAGVVTKHLPDGVVRGEREGEKRKEGEERKEREEGERGERGERRRKGRKTEREVREEKKEEREGEEGKADWERILEEAKKPVKADWERILEEALEGR